MRELNSLSFAADGTLATFCMNRELCFWDMARGQQQSRRSLPDHVSGAAVSPDCRVVATRCWHSPDNDNGVEFWDVTGKPAAGWKTLEMKKVSALQFAPDGKTVWTIAGSQAVQWDPTSGKALRTFPATGAGQLAFSPDGKTAAAFGSDGREPAGACSTCGT
jgi:WD40 repeat protein